MDCCAPADEEALTVVQLSTGEQLLLWAIRTRLEGRDRVGKVQEAFKLAAHPGRGLGFECFEPWFLVLSSHARRDLMLHRAPCPCLSADELIMLRLVATQQTSLTGLAGDLAGDLVEHCAIGPLLEAGGSLAVAFRNLGLNLPQRSRMVVAPEGRPRLH